MIFISCLLGKSNLMDAISFVFGERTQSLRVRTVKVSLPEEVTHVFVGNTCS